MVDAVYRGNVEELLSVLNHLKKYIIVFVIVLLVLISIFHYSKYSVQVVPLITVILVLLPAVYYTTVLVLKFGASVMGSNQPVSIMTGDVCSLPVTSSLVRRNINNLLLLSTLRPKTIRTFASFGNTICRRSTLARAHVVK